MEGIVRRKWIATFVTSIIAAIAVSVILFLENLETEKPQNFIYLASTLSFYTGAIIFVYGNAVSAFIEFVKNKWWNMNTILFIVSHGLFGVILIPYTFIGPIAIGSAILYAIVDRWVFFRMKNEKAVGYFYLAPFLMMGICFLVLTVLKVA